MGRNAHRSAAHIVRDSHCGNSATVDSAPRSPVAFSPFTSSPDAHIKPALQPGETTIGILLSINHHPGLTFTHHGYHHYRANPNQDSPRASSAEQAHEARWYRPQVWRLEGRLGAGRIVGLITLFLHAQSLMCRSAVIKGAIPRERADKYADGMYSWLEGL